MVYIHWEVNFSDSVSVYDKSAVFGSEINRIKLPYGSLEINIDENYIDRYFPIQWIETSDNAVGLIYNRYYIQSRIGLVKRLH